MTLEEYKARRRADFPRKVWAAARGAYEVGKTGVEVLICFGAALILSGFCGGW